MLGPRPNFRARVQYGKPSDNVVNYEDWFSPTTVNEPSHLLNHLGSIEDP